MINIILYGGTDPLGDANSDGVLNVIDVVIIVNLILSQISDDTVCQNDYNDDGVVNVIDVVTIVLFILGEWES